MDAQIEPRWGKKWHWGRFSLLPFVFPVRIIPLLFHAHSLTTTLPYDTVIKTLTKSATL
jgi:hypothetical protein